MTQPAAASGSSSIEKTENESQASLRSAHVVMVGVPAEIAVAISVASFLIGAALTGMLCCIHHRKAMPKSVSCPSFLTPFSTLTYSLIISRQCETKQMMAEK